MEHIIHLGAGAFVVALNPKWRSRPPRAGALGDDEDDEDDDEDDEDEQWMVDWVESPPPPSESLNHDPSEAVEIDTAIEFDAGDLLGKLLALINQV